MSVMWTVSCSCSGGRGWPPARRSSAGEGHCHASPEPPSTSRCASDLAHTPEHTAPEITALHSTHTHTHYKMACAYVYTGPVSSTQQGTGMWYVVWCTYVVSLSLSHTLLGHNHTHVHVHCHLHLSKPPTHTVYTQSIYRWAWLTWVGGLSTGLSAILNILRESARCLSVVGRAWIWLQETSR